MKFDGTQEVALDALDDVALVELVIVAVGDDERLDDRLSEDEMLDDDEEDFKEVLDDEELEGGGIDDDELDDSALDDGELEDVVLRDVVLSSVVLVDVDVVLGWTEKVFEDVESGSMLPGDAVLKVLPGVEVDDAVLAKVALDRVPVVLDVVVAVEAVLLTAILDELTVAAEGVGTLSEEATVVSLLGAKAATDNTNWIRKFPSRPSSSAAPAAALSGIDWAPTDATAT
ncbi:hypothetical protein CMUS01_08582 [Colletotrichum musicola]|uniref:Uncharacterized protein n=1 Tax=Colletotrichum musicola TaxID=2175873 RepID=A0A8H6NCP4_9PEZI|nr:hypothetical protein CMUS01_08582 [Colletotrichum musicola]